MYSGWGTVFGHHLSPGEEEAILKMPWSKTAMLMVSTYT